MFSSFSSSFSSSLTKKTLVVSFGLMAKIFDSSGLKAKLWPHLASIPKLWPRLRPRGQNFAIGLGVEGRGRGQNFVSLSGRIADQASALELIFHEVVCLPSASCGRQSAVWHTVDVVAVDGKDHTECCYRRSVPGLCHAYCTGRPIDSNLQAFLCLAYTEEIFSCFREGTGL